jgi:hypothetical protein
MNKCCLEYSGNYCMKCGEFSHTQPSKCPFCGCSGVHKHEYLHNTHGRNASFEYAVGCIREIGCGENRCGIAYRKSVQAFGKKEYSLRTLEKLIAKWNTRQKKEESNND